MLKNADTFKNSLSASIEEGLQLAETSEAQGGLKEYFANTSDIDKICSLPGATRSKEEIVAMTASVMENERKNNNARQLFEGTTSQTVGGFQDQLLPIIRAAFPANPILDLVSVQPLNRRHGQIFFMDYIIGQTKGRYTAGQRLFDAQSGYRGGWHYSDEYIDRELLVTASSSGSLSGTLQYAGNGSQGVRPGTVEIIFTASTGAQTVILRDQGNGVLVAETDVASDFDSGTVNYATGAVSIALNNNVSGPVYASYEADLEGSSNLPQIDIRITSEPVTARRNALRQRYSSEAAMDYLAEFGRDLRPELSAGVAATLATEQSREILADLWNAAGAPYTNFDISHNSSTAGYARREHFGDIMYPINQTVQQMYQETQRNRANWMVVDVNMANVLLTLGEPYFTKWTEAAFNQRELGMKFLGVFNGSIRVYMDSLLSNLPGASTVGNALLGYKGSDFDEVAYIWAPYRVMYSTPAVTLDDMVTRQAFASRAARKLVNPRLLKRFELIAS